MRRSHVVALSAVSAAAFGLLGLRAVELPHPRPISDADRLRIEVVHPREPDIQPGSVMEVGELVDGFQGLPPPLPRLEEVAWSYDEGWEDADAARPERRPVAAIFVPAPPERREPPPRYESRWFGFDAPARDFRAERAARRARLEAMDRRAREVRDARRREWAERREEWRERRDRDRDAGWSDRPPTADLKVAGPVRGAGIGDPAGFAGAW